MAIKLRELTDEEKAAIAKLARSRTAAAREVERAGIILLALKGRRAPAIAQDSELTEITVRSWLKRFNNEGPDGLADLPRSGRPATYSAEQVAASHHYSADGCSLALRGRRFETWAEVEQSIEAATAYWNRNRHPFIWGRRRRHQPRRHSGIAKLPKAA